MDIYIVVELKTNYIEGVFDTTYLANKKANDLTERRGKKYIVLTRELEEVL